MATAASLVHWLLNDCQISFDFSSYSWEGEPSQALLCELVHTDHKFLAFPMGRLSLDCMSSLGSSVVSGLGLLWGSLVVERTCRYT